MISEIEKKLREANESAFRQGLFRDLLQGKITPEQYAEQSGKLLPVKMRVVS